MGLGGPFADVYAIVLIEELFFLTPPPSMIIFDSLSVKILIIFIDFNNYGYHKWSISGPYLKSFAYYLSSADSFQNLTFSKNSFGNTTSVSSRLGQDQALHLVGPDLVPNCLQI